MIREQMHDIVRNAEKEGRQVLTTEEDARFKAFDTDYNALTEQWETSKKIEALKAESAEQSAKANTEKQVLTPDEQREADDKLFWKFMKGGHHSVSQDELHRLHSRRADTSQFRGTSTQITVTDSLGGYLIPKSFSNELEKRMAFYGGMLEASRILRTDNGEQIEWPTVDDTATTGALTSESSPSIAVADLTFGQKLLNAYTYDSNIIKVSVQLLQDSYFNLEDEVQSFFAERLGRKLNTDLTLADGSSKPQGIVPAITNIVNAADDVTIARNDLLTVQHGVDRAYRDQGSYMFSDTTLLAIKKLAVGSGDARPLWVPSMRENEPDTIEGYRFYINNDMASIASGAKPVIFGDFNKYIIRIVQDMMMVPLRELYMASLQVGYIAYMRADGELIQPNAMCVLRNITT